MAKKEIVNLQGHRVDELEIADELFEIKPNKHSVYRAVITYLANNRQGTVSTKTRGEVRGGGKKPWRQKGTGRARHGSTRSPIWRGGGVVFGPKPRDYSLKLNKKEKNSAIFSSIIAKLDNIIILDKFEFETPKVKDGCKKFLKSFNLIDKKVLIIYGNDGNKNAHLSCRNFKKVHYVNFDNLTTYWVLWADKLVFTKDAFSKLQEVIVW